MLNREDLLVVVVFANDVPFATSDVVALYFDVPQYSHLEDELGFARPQLLQYHHVEDDVDTDFPVVDDVIVDLPDEVLVDVADTFVAPAETLLDVLAAVELGFVVRQYGQYPSVLGT